MPRIQIFIRHLQSLPATLALGLGLAWVAVPMAQAQTKRCVDTSIAAGMTAAAPAGYDMPKAYDAQSGQPWTRSRLAYLMHDIRERITDRRDLLVKSES